MIASPKLSPLRAIPGVALALLVVIGCSDAGPYTGTLYPVTGRVLLSDGEPLSGGSIQFIPKLGGLPASGTIKEDGVFALKSHKGRQDGAAPGEYKVRIDPGSDYLISKRKGVSIKLPFAARYRDYDGETGLTAVVGPGDTKLEPFRLDANKK